MKKTFACFVVATAVALLSVGSASSETITPKCYTTNTRVMKKSIDVAAVTRSVAPTESHTPPELVDGKIEKTCGLIFTADKTVARDGECIQLSGVVKNTAGYPTIFNIDSEGNAWCLYPNKFVPDGREFMLNDGDKVAIPAPDADFCLKVQAPFGKERIYAILTKEPLDPASVNAKSFVLESATKVDAALLEKCVIPEVVKKKADITYIEITTLPNTP